jgi:YidC/Oxa1 family membrane protein insertase
MYTIAGVFAKPMGLIITALYNLIGSYGWALVILTIVVKLALYPLYAKQIKSMTGMAAHQEDIKAIQNRYADDKQMQQAKIQEFYAENNISPMAGCWPMLVQMIVIMGLFTLLRNPVRFLGRSEDILYAVHESFFWLPDLCQPDKWILPIAAAVATYISFTLSQRNNPPQAPQPGQPNMGGMMKIMKYIFPVMILLMARTYPSALAVYWFLSQLIQIGYNLRFKKVREDILEDTKRKENG